MSYIHSSNLIKLTQFMIIMGWPLILFVKMVQLLLFYKNVPIIIFFLQKYIAWSLNFFLQKWLEFHQNFQVYSNENFKRKFQSHRSSNGDERHTITDNGDFSNCRIIGLQFWSCMIIDHQSSRKLKKKIYAAIFNNFRNKFSQLQRPIDELDIRFLIIYLFNFTFDM